MYVWWDRVPSIVAASVIATSTSVVATSSSGIGTSVIAPSTSIIAATNIFWSKQDLVVYCRIIFLHVATLVRP